ncbi:protein XRI1-like isoform X1 [Solanum dulcamara]|uniref:protein XRI1-like isoform X1 n=1 Tax=Solanum dulcamara TaxID=45834 RepID=UPI0024862DC1|nr:protein XRI1-like isoform X1 [Solanum dulcamara]
MGDLHSIAYNGFSSLGCDFNGLEVFNNDMSPFIESTPPFLSNLDCDLSSGYLQDALFKFSSKRRRLLLFNDDDEKENYQNKDSNNSIKNLWSSTIDQQFSEDYDSFSQITKCDSFSGDLMSKMSEEYSKRTEEEAISENYYYSSNSSPTSSSHHNNIHKQPLQYGGGDQKRSKKRMSGKIVYPFGLVKPGGKEGDVTLNDINERILMRPTRPVRHPVGDFACRPTVCPAGPGLSGKTVVALTKIHTQGRGTITIIRTRG